MKHLFLLVSVLALSISCAKKDDDSDLSKTSEENVAMTGALAKVNTVTSATANLFGSTPAFVSQNRNSELHYFEKAITAASAITPVWTTPGGVVSLENGTNTTLQGWFDNEFDPDFVNSNDAKVTFAGRISNALNVFCFLGYSGFSTDSTGLAAAGNHVLKVTSKMAATCHDASMTGASLPILVTATTDTTYYDKKFEVTTDSDCPFIFYARSNSTAINVATAEDQSCDGRDQGSRTIFHYNKTTGKATFEYISQAFTDESGGGRGFEFYRGYLDETNDKAYMLGIYGGDAGGTLDGYIAYSAVGKPTAGGTTALSVEVDNQTVVANGTKVTYEACIDSATNAISSDNTLACTLTGVTVEDNAETAGAIRTAHTTNTSIADIAVIGESTAPSFTDNTDMY